MCGRSRGVGWGSVCVVMDIVMGIGIGDIVAVRACDVGYAGV